MSREIRRSIIQRALMALKRELAFLGRMIRDAEQRILAQAALRGRRGTITAILLALLSDLYDEISRYLTVTAERLLRASRQYVWDMLSAGARLMMGVPVDTSGEPKFAPGEPRRVRGEGLREILRSIAPLLVRRGSRVASSRVDPLDAIMPITDGRIMESRDRYNPSVSRSWQEKFRFIHPTLRTLESQLAEDDVNAGQVVHRARQQIEVWLSSELAHETIRVVSNAEMDVYGAYNPVVAGYTLHSRFWPTTDPVHASNDGMKFYRDNREGSSLPWDQRLIPPYRKNCVCFTTPIIDIDPDVSAMSGYGPVIGGGNAYSDVEARDIAVYAEWFRWQNPNTQRALMGDQRYMAAASMGGGRLTLDDFLTTDGKLMTPRQILEESPVERQARKAIVAARIRRLGDMLRQMWETGRWNSTPQAEDENLEEILGGS